MHRIREDNLRCSWTISIAVRHRKVDGVPFTLEKAVGSLAKIMCLPIPSRTPYMIRNGQCPSETWLTIKLPGYVSGSEELQVSAGLTISREDYNIGASILMLSLS